MPPFVSRKRHRSPPPEPSDEATSSKKARVAPPKPVKPAKPAKPAAPGKRSLYDTLDDVPKVTRSLSDVKALVKELEGDDEEDEELSDVDSDEFEDVLPQNKAADKASDHSVHDDESEGDWEDAMQPASKAHVPEPEISGDISIALPSNGQAPEDFEFSWSDKKDVSGKKGPSKIERQIRINTHSMHVQFLMWHNLMRNAWVQDKEVQRILADGVMAHEGCKKEIERWKRAAGLVPTAVEEIPKPDKAKKGSRGKAKGKNASKDTKTRARDWSHEAARVEEGVPDLSRGDPLKRLLQYLSAYWKKRFRVTAPGLRKRGYMTMQAIQEEMEAFNKHRDDAITHGERVKNVKQFRECARKLQGSRDVGAQLFTALLRGLGIEARMVASLQPAGIGWSKVEEAAPKKKGPQKTTPKKKKAGSLTEEDSVIETTPPKRASKKAITNGERRSARGEKSSPINVDDTSSALSSVPPSEDESVAQSNTPSKINPSQKFDRDLPLPLYWTEAISPNTHSVIPVSPLVLSTVATTDELLNAFEPRGKEAEKAKLSMSYIIAFSADGSAKDVTVRYLKKHLWPGKTKGNRIMEEKVPIYNRRGKVLRYELHDWFKTVMAGYAKSSLKRTPADEKEDQAELVPIRPSQAAKANAGEETLQWYKNSAEFVLERHLRREEGLLPNAKPVRQFASGKGEKATTEDVFRRKDVVVCKTVESWHKEGRAVKTGEQPLKHVKMRAVTIIRKREIEEVERETGEKATQGLYAKFQTDWIIPEPIKDGKIPRNAFGNIDVYVPTMVPKGAIHIPLKRTAQICRKLGIDYAEACTGFEFGKQRAVPVITGVVVAVENEDKVIDAWEEEEEARKRKEDKKREELVLKTWRKFVMGLRILERVKEEYGTGGEGLKDEFNPFTSRNGSTSVLKAQNTALPKKRWEDEDEDDERSKLFPAEGVGEGGFVRDDARGGGFMFEDEPKAEDLGGGGFMIEDEPDGNTAGGGGFMVDDDQDEQAEKTAAAGGSYPVTPMSLQSSHHKLTAADDDEDGEEDGLEEPSEPEPPKKKRKQVNKKAAASLQAQATKTSTKKASTTEASTTKPKAKTPSRSKSVPKESQTPDSSSALSEPDGEDDEDSDAGIPPISSPHFTSSTKQAATRPIRHPEVVIPAPMRSKRQAARKSQDAVKSHYFDSGESVGDDKDEEDAPTIKRSARRSSGRVKR